MEYQLKLAIDGAKNSVRFRHQHSQLVLMGEFLLRKYCVLPAGSLPGRENAQRLMLAASNKLHEKYDMLVVYKSINGGYNQLAYTWFESRPKVRLKQNFTQEAKFCLFAPSPFTATFSTLGGGIGFDRYPLPRHKIWKTALGANGKSMRNQAVRGASRCRSAQFWIKCGFS